mmetsp:Transcript_6867/g.16854  ORF Transcript_6867/g.16854 Transcript_6867/m.16854 type:complete len:223 (+) Transcript_6867:1413-2081(+)
MPMKTTFLSRGFLRRASTTWATISALPTWRISPSTPVMQNRQPTAQPTWLDTQTPSRGSSTVSTVWPSCSPSSSRAQRPSLPGCSLRSASSPSSSAIRPGRACISAWGSQPCSGCLPASSGRHCSQWRSTRLSWAGLAPSARRRWRRSEINMGRPIVPEASRHRDAGDSGLDGSGLCWAALRPPSPQETPWPRPLTPALMNGRSAATSPPSTAWPRCTAGTT